MARLISERGGDCRQVAAAACLAGPAVFSSCPDARIDKKVRAFADHIMVVEQGGVQALSDKMPQLSADARLFLQVSAVMLLDRMAGEGTHDSAAAHELQDSYIEALALYSCARGMVDTYKLDTRFEIAAMKVTTILESSSHIWARPRAAAAQMEYV